MHLKRQQDGSAEPVRIRRPPCGAIRLFAGNSQFPVPVAASSSASCCLLFLVDLLLLTVPC
eukprot:7608580-Pyramimonas_sp.AAC.1